ncbi:MAG: CDP-alcohol phosphatidyltransferase family protein, partial [Clostridia bacterium]|nr:CDP-alcohol phosphatidyltransferase family protein [Clostridia bacterium]
MSKLKQIFTIPNILSFIRIGLIPFIVIAYVEGNLLLSAILLASSALTDIVDGFIARRFNQVSPLGKALDPIA